PHLGLGRIDRRYIERATERCRHHGDWHAAMQVGAVALEERVRRDGKEDVEIARRSAAHPRLALAGKPDAGSILDARRDVDRERALARDPSRAGAGRARIFDHLAATLARRAGAFEREEALCVADPALAAARRTRARPCAGLGTSARACFAGDGGRDAD